MDKRIELTQTVTYNDRNYEPGTLATLVSPDIEKLSSILGLSKDPSGKFNTYVAGEVLKMIEQGELAWVKFDDSAHIRLIEAKVYKDHEE